MEGKKRFDFKSISFRVWGYFILFSIMILGLVWLLQIYFLDTFYEEMKLKESERIASNLIQEFRSDNDMETFTGMLTSAVEESDMIIRIESGDGRIIISPSDTGIRPYNQYANETLALRTKLQTSEFPTYSEVIEGPNKSRTLTYACYLQKADGRTAEENMSNSIILYMFSPLYPVKSTVSILRTQLRYITIIALLLALSMSIYLAAHISKPINDITKSAAEMGKGNYGVQFKGGPYTEIKELADTLTTASRELEKTDMYQKDLIANVSHDLKTPLTMIKSYAEMIRDLSGDNPSKREEHLGVIIDEADRLNVLVDDMLTMSRMQRRNIELEKTNFDITECTSSILSSYAILSEQEGYHITFKNPGPVLVNGDETRIKQVISNLINNAVKYCGEDKEVGVTIKKVGRRVRFEVKDDGQGIAPDEISHVWERYYKSSTNHVRPTEGTGLGLSIVKEILTLHKASYGVNSKVGKGSTFWFEMDQVKEKKTRGIRQGNG